VLSGATAEPVGPRSMLYLALAGVMDHVEDERLDRINAWFFRARYPPETAEPIIAGGFWSKGGARALHALVGERFIPRLAAYPGKTLILNGEHDVIFRLSAAPFAAAAVDARRVLLAGATHLASLDRPLAFSEGFRRLARPLPSH
jgi:pimeloyl-ACP methyl ester carboxylesterase